MASLALAFDILAKDNASATLNKVGDAAEKTGGKGKALGLAFAGVAAAGAAGLFAVLKNGQAEFSDNQTAMAQFEAGLKSTGNVAGITSKEMVGLADAIEAKTGTDGASVVAGGALLATFTKVRNEVGLGNDVFSRATQAGVDLAAKGFGSVESNAILLGKALNDPVKGLAALGKQGVTFTADQKTLIASLVETGDTLGAQKIILAEIEGQVGGSAAAYGETLPGQLARARAAFDGVTETVFKAVLPAVTQLLEFVTARLIPGFQSFATQVGPAVTQVATVIRDVILPAVVGAGAAFLAFGQAIPTPLLIAGAVALGAVVTVLTAAAAINSVAAAATAAYTAVKAVFITTTNAETGAQTLSTLAQARATVAKAAGTVATIAMTVATTALGIAIKVATGPVGLIFAALALLVTGLIAAYKNSETFRNIVNAAFAAVKTAATAVFSYVAGFIAEQLGNVVSIARGAVNVVVGIFTGDFGRIKDGVGQALGGVVSLVTAVPGRILGALGNLGGLLVNAGRELMEGLARGIGDKISAVVGKVRDAVALIGRLLPGSPIKDGPLKSWNGGGAGLRLMGMLGDGIAKGAPAVAAGLNDALRVSPNIGGLSTSASGGETGGSLASLMRENNDLLRALPRGYMLGQRKMAGV